jgi:hypothetical protein
MIIFFVREICGLGVQSRWWTSKAGNTYVATHRFLHLVPLPQICLAARLDETLRCVERLSAILRVYSPSWDFRGEGFGARLLLTRDEEIPPPRFDTS